MGDQPNQTSAPPAAPDEAGPTTLSQVVSRDRRVVRTVDLTDEDIAAIEASQMELGYEHLDAELDPPPTSLVARGIGFARKLRHRGRGAECRAAIWVEALPIQIVAL